MRVHVLVQVYRCTLLVRFVTCILQVAANALHTPSISTTNVTDLLENLEPTNTVPDVPHGASRLLSKYSYS